MPTQRKQPLAVFVDSDVVLAGSASTTGASHLILQLSEFGLVHALASQQVRREVERNLADKIPAALAAFRLIAEAAIHWVDDPTPEAAEEFRGQADEKDLPILVAAVREGSASLVTVHVRHYKPKGGVIRIERPGEFIRRLREHLSALSE